jgi:hypothetical protein
MRHLDIMAELLDLAAEEFSNHGCSDYALPNTDANWRMIVDMHYWSQEEGDPPKRPGPAEEIMTTDWLLMNYMSFLCTEELEEKSDG